ncbi:hypothetical protein PybrP1_011420 [[Pythium] brassicae (nom. inval.)]|nr:hypothetical protein PybrP1_011420 [[Pythium] brassicae (nom. inval.)]
MVQRVAGAARGAPPSQPHRVGTFVAFMGFGLASWIMTNASYIELGVFLQKLPEKYSIYAYSFVRQSTVIWWLLVIGVLGAVLMSALWDKTARVFGEEHSVAMLLLTHVGGLVSATSTVVFYPYVATFPSIYTSALSTGEGLSGSVAALMGVIQEPYDPTAMRFSVTVFYLICAGIMVVSLASFAFLQLHPWAKRARAEGELPPHGKKPHADEEAAPLVVGDDRPVSAAASIQASSAAIPEPSRREILRHVWQFLACQLALAAFSFGVLPSVMSYVYRKYAPLDDMEGATSRYQTIASIASLILDPVARVLTSWWRVYRVRSFTCVLLAVAVMLLVFALVSTPFLSGPSTPNGYLLPLLSHILYLGAYAYTQTMIFLTLKRESQQFNGEYAHVVYQWSGFCTQIGAFTGTIIIFPLVFFKEEIFLQ